MSQDPTSDRLEALFAVGERMFAALEEGDLEQFFVLLEERGTLIDELPAYVDPAKNGADWSRWAQALDEQQQVLAHAAAAGHRRLGEALASMGRYKSARQQYQPRPRPGSILDQNLSG